MLCFFLIFSLSVLNAQDSIYIRPSATDPFINGIDSLHYVAINRTVSSCNKLLLFLPGTGAQTSQYTRFLNTSANLGLHSIGLSYENELAPEFLCLLNKDTTCFERARFENWFGEDMHPAINVDGYNCIYYRLVKLLLYLNEVNPDDHWDQFLDENDSIQWTKVKIAGHSQGGNHAAYLSKLEKTDRCLIFSSRDWMAYHNEPASWVQRPGKTAPEDYYGFVHELDSNAFGLNSEILLNWHFFGMDQFGDLVNTDTINTPFSGSHMLSTSLPQPPGNNVHHYFHRTVVGNLDTPLDNEGTPVYESVWEYMLGDTGFSTGEISKIEFKPRVLLYPNPVSDILYIETPAGNDHMLKAEVFSIVGIKILEIENQHSIDLNTLKEGSYYVRLKINENLNIFRIVKLISR